MRSAHKSLTDKQDEFPTTELQPSSKVYAGLMILKSADAKQVKATVNKCYGQVIEETWH